MGCQYSHKFSLLFLCFLFAFSTALEDSIDQYDHQNPPPLAQLRPRDVDSRQATEQPPVNMTSPAATAPPPNTVNTLLEAIVLAVMSGICGPSLFALIACGIRQIRLTWDDPFAGGERPVDEAAERRKRKQLQQQQSRDDDEEYINNFRSSKTVNNNLDPMALDRVTSLDLDQIRAKPLSSTKYSNTEKNLAGKLNKGYSKTAEDIL